MMTNLSQITSKLELAAGSSSATAIFFKTGEGDYAEHDQFIGVSNPALRSIAKEFHTLSLLEIQTLIESPFNEKRLLALFILVNHYQKGSIDKETCFQFYIRNLAKINNWNLVDASAHWIVGAHLMEGDKALLFKLAKSDNMWERRIAIVATWYFIRHDSFEWTIKLAELLRHDRHDLIHKAVGWMLREVGKRDLDILIRFLEQYANTMPRTMLRYAIEKLSAERRAIYMQK
jgi:3-methyladenine DNA glycosylase AlkD